MNASKANPLPNGQILPDSFSSISWLTAGGPRYVVTHVSIPASCLNPCGYGGVVFEVSTAEKEILQRLTEQDWTPTDLADELDTSRNTIYNHHDERGNPDEEEGISENKAENRIQHRRRRPRIRQEPAQRKPGLIQPGVVEWQGPQSWERGFERGCNIQRSNQPYHEWLVREDI